MKNKDAIYVIKIVVILALVFCAVAQILPWRGFSIDSSYGSAGVDFYTWGGHVYTSIYNPIYGSSQSFDIWSIFYLINIGLPDTISGVDISSMIASSFTAENLAATTLFVLTFIFCIITIIAGILTLRKQNASLIAGITALISIIIFVVGISIAFAQDPTGILSDMAPYTIGFILMIISMILFFVAFIMHYILLPSPSPNLAQPKHTYPGYEPPQSTKDYKFKPKDTLIKKICSECSGKIEGNPKYCLNCGKKLR